MVVSNINEKAFSKTVITYTGVSRWPPTLERDSCEEENEKKEQRGKSGQGHG